MTIEGNALPDYSYSRFEGAEYLSRFLSQRRAWRKNLPSAIKMFASGEGELAGGDFEKEKKTRAGWAISKVLSAGAAMVQEENLDLQRLNILMKTLDLLHLRNFEIKEEDRGKTGYLLEKEESLLKRLLNSLPPLDRESPTPEPSPPGENGPREFGFLLCRSPRSLAYGQGLARAGILPKLTIVFGPDPFVPAAAWGEEKERMLRQLIRDFGWNHSDCTARRVSNPEILRAVEESGISPWVYSGGGIVPETFFKSGRRFLHVHPGILPDDRGSTVFYFTILGKGRIGATAFEMAAAIDAGPVVMTRHYRVPEDGDWDTEYDPAMRTDLLIRSLPFFLRGKSRPVSYGGKRPFTIIHPVLKHIAILHARNHRFAVEAYGG